MRKIILIILVFLHIGSLCQATTFTTDGVIDGGTYSDVTIESTATVDMTAGTVETMLIRQSGTLNFLGGTIQDEIYLYDAGILNLEGANFQGTQGMWMYNASEFNLNSGSLTGVIDLSNYVNVSINGGQVINGELNSNYYAITDIHDGDTAWDSVLLCQFSKLNVYGGTVNWQSIGILESAVLNIYGGDVTFEHGFNLSGDNAEINVHYSSVIYDKPGGIIIGYHLLDNSEFMLEQFTYSEIDQINFVPEPTTLVLLGLGGLFLRKLK